jgi:hypothetical protein
MFKAKKIIEFAKIAITVAVLAIGTSYALADWTAPRYSPPTCPAGDAGCDAPINVSRPSQVKAGGLGLGGAFTTKGKTILSHGQNEPTIADNLRTKIYGRVGAKAYCDEEGNNCIVPGAVTTGPGGSSFSFDCPKGEALNSLASDGSFTCVKTGFNISLPGLPGLPGGGGGGSDTGRTYTTDCGVTTCRSGYYVSNTQVCERLNSSNQVTTSNRVVCSPK